MKNKNTVEGWIESMSIKRAETVALGSTTVAFGLTAVLAGTGYAVESNPLAESVIKTVGWVGAGVLALLGEVLIIEGYRRVVAPRRPRIALVGSWSIASIGILDVLANLWILSRVGTPPALSRRLIGAIAVVSFAALVLARRELVIEALRYQREHVGPTLRTVALFAVILSLAVGGLTPFVGPANYSNTVSASDPTVIDDFESGSFGSKWTTDSGWTIEERYAKEGSYSMNGTETTSTLREATVSVSNSHKFSFYMNMSSYATSANPRVILKDSGDDIGPEIAVDSDGTLLYQNKNGFQDTGVAVNLHEYYKIEFEPDDSANTYNLSMIAENGTEVYSNDGISIYSGTAWDGTAKIVHQNRDGGSVNIDYIGSGGATLPTAGGKDTYSQTYELDDRSGLFPPDRSTISVAEWDPGTKSLDGPTSSSEWSHLETKTFNSEDRATFDLVDGNYYRVTVEQGGDSWEVIGYEANSSDTSTTLLIKESTLIETKTPTPTPETPTLTSGTPTPTREPLTPYPNGTTPTPYPTETKPPQEVEGPAVLGKCEVSGKDGVAVEYWDPNYETSTLEYNLTGPDGDLYEGTKEFDDPRGYYRGCIGNATLNGTDPGDAGGNYSGGYTDGETFNGSLDYPSGESLFGGPVGGGSSGSSNATRYGGWLIVAAGGALAYRRFGNGQIGRSLARVSERAGRLLNRR